MNSFRRLVLLCIDYSTRSSPFAYELPLYGIEMPLPADEECSIGMLVGGMLPITLLDPGDMDDSPELKYAVVDILALYNAHFGAEEPPPPTPLKFKTTLLLDEVVCCSIIICC